MLRLLYFRVFGIRPYIIWPEINSFSCFIAQPFCQSDNHPAKLRTIQKIVKDTLLILAHPKSQLPIFKSEAKTGIRPG
jgi:hypothetical protein